MADQCYQSVVVQTFFDYGSGHVSLFFAKALQVTKVPTEKTPPVA